MEDNQNTTVQTPTPAASSTSFMDKLKAMLKKLKG
jgi:hypothetical protein